MSVSSSITLVGRPHLNRDRIVTAAIELADTDGLDAVSMRSLGTRLGCDATAVYRHFDTKDALLDAVADHLLATIVLPTPGGQPLDEIRTIADAVRHAATTHPDLAPLLAYRPPLGPNGRRIAEGLLDALQRAGLAPDRAASALQILVAYTLGTLTNPTFTNPDPSNRRRDEITDTISGDDDHPLLRAATDHFAANHTTDLFQHGISAIMRGLTTETATQKRTSTRSD